MAATKVGLEQKNYLLNRIPGTLKKVVESIGKGTRLCTNQDGIPTATSAIRGMNIHWFISDVAEVPVDWSFDSIWLWHSYILIREGYTGVPIYIYVCLPTTMSFQSYLNVVGVLTDYVFDGVST